MNNLSLIIIIGVIGIVIGFALGSLVGMLRGDRPQADKPKPAEQPRRVTQKPTAVVGAPIPPVIAPVEVSQGPELNRQRMGPVTVIANAIQSDVAIPDIPKSIALQVDEILQEKLKGTPQEKRGIKLMELPSKGMVVLVGLNQYDSVESVPDDDVRSLIRSAVMEWEKRVSEK